MIRYPLFFSLLLALLWMLASCSPPPDKSGRLTQSFNNHWEFCITSDSAQTALQDAGWETVSLPHTPQLEPLVVTNQWQGTCWYRKTFQLPDRQSGAQYFLKFEGAMHVADVWVNGQKLYRHVGGYLPFIVDFSELVRKGEPNEVLVRLDNRDNPTTGPKPLEALDFNMYGGLYRDVNLMIKNPVYISDPMETDAPGGGGVFIRTLEAEASQATLSIQTHIRNSGSSETATTLIQELWKDGKRIKQTETDLEPLSGKTDRWFGQEILVKNPALWSPKTPSLYTLRTNLVANGRIIDAEETTFGIKWIDFRDHQLFLNGQQIFLRGVNRHQEYPYIGYALSNRAQYRDAQKIKEAGFDYVRLSHYPHAPAFMQACDELGLLVIDAILGWQYYSDNPAFEQHIYHTAADLVRRDRNHACVLAWEVSLNESWMPDYFIDSLNAIAHREYPGNQCFTAGWQEYGYDIYLQARQHRLKHYKTPRKPYVVSEYGDWEYYAQNAGLNQDSWRDLEEEERTSRQLLSAGEKRLLQQATNIQEAHNDNFNTPAFADGYWVMFDYNRGYSNDLEASGILSIHRLPKFSYHFFRSQRDATELSGLYDSGPMVYIASYWDSLSPTDIRIFSNCEAVELYLNDSLIGRQLPDDDARSSNLAHPPFTFRVDQFVPGTLLAKGYIGTKLASSHERRTPGEAVALHAWMDTGSKEPVAGEQDVVFVHCALVDVYGTRVPLNHEPLKFQLEGPATFASPHLLRTEAGVASALIRIGHNAGTIHIVCSSPELQEARVQLEIE